MIGRFELPVDDHTHEFSEFGPDDIVHVGPDHVANRPNVVQIWAKVSSARTKGPTHLLVVGTGHPFPDAHVRHIGSAVTSHGLVWHVLAITPNEVRQG